MSYLSVPVLLCSLLLALFTPGHALAEIDPLVRIAFFTDLHYISPSLTDHGPAFMKVINHADGKVTLYCEELAESFIEQVQSLDVTAVVLQGDLTFNGATESHMALATRLSVLREAGIPVYVIPGNHDVYNRNAARFVGEYYARVGSATSEDFARIWADFGFSQALSRDSTSLSYTVDLSPDLRLLMVDVNTEGNIGVLKEETLVWVEKELQRAQRGHRAVLAVSHQTLFAHNSLFVSGFQMKGAGRLEALYRKYGVLCNVSGHMHAMHITGTKTGLPEISVSSASVSPCQFGLLTLYRDQMEFHTRQIPVSEWAAENDLSNPDLLNFSQYAGDFFSEEMNRQMAAPAAEQTEEMRDYAGRLNAAYFAGNLTDFSADDAMYRKLCSSADITALYFESIRSDLGQNYTKLRYTFGGAPE